MRLILFLLLFSACKKTEVTLNIPVIEPSQVQPQCNTQDTLYSGKWRYTGGNNDTIQIIFLHNNCPTENSNTYLVKNIGKAFAPLVKPGRSFPVKDYTISVSGNTLSANIDPSPVFSLRRDVGQIAILRVSCIELVNNNYTFNQIK